MENKDILEMFEEIKEKILDLDKRLGTVEHQLRLQTLQSQAYEKIFSLIVQTNITEGNKSDYIKGGYVRTGEGFNSTRKKWGKKPLF